jgi:hypothetical protein
MRTCRICKKEKNIDEIIKKSICKKDGKLIIEFICKFCENEKWLDSYENFKTRTK